MLSNCPYNKDVYFYLMSVYRDICKTKLTTNKIVYTFVQSCVILIVILQLSSFNCKEVQWRNIVLLFLYKIHDYIILLKHRFQQHLYCLALTPKLNVAISKRSVPNTLSRSCIVYLGPCNQEHTNSENFEGVARRSTKHDLSIELIFSSPS